MDVKTTAIIETVKFKFEWNIEFISNQNCKGHVFQVDARAQANIMSKQAAGNSNAHNVSQPNRNF